jgi:hypothetical protein
MEMSLEWIIFTSCGPQCLKIDLGNAVALQSHVSKSEVLEVIWIR